MLYFKFKAFFHYFFYFYFQNLFSNALVVYESVSDYSLAGFYADLSLGFGGGGAGRCRAAS